jgi:2-polyprenyl-6-methoxyphenol hydroxylase-like FAD-dependent oxidoreductase
VEDVLVVGAGPTGLVLALWLAQQGIKVRIIDKSVGPGETSRAMAVQARTLELYRQLDIAETVVAAGYRNPSVNLWVHGKRKAQVTLADAGKDLTPYPFVLIFPQDQHERLLIERLEAMGVHVQRQTELLDFEDMGDHVKARLQAGGGEQICEARYIAGCDGAHSTVRHEIGADFKGGTYRQTFYVADVEARGMNPPNQIHASFEGTDFVALFGYGHDDMYRLIGTIDESRMDGDALTFDDVGHLAVDALGVRIDKVNWFSTYRVHHRVTDRFRHERAFLVGDAAHVHSPAGGQGMNTGIGDAINLAWKLATVVKGKAPDSLLDTYQGERMAFAHRLVDTTDRVFSFVAAEGSFANFVRLRIAPLFIGVATSFSDVREYMFRLISQTMLNYHGSPLSVGFAHKVLGGDRLPWVRLANADNYAPLAAITWQVHVYGTAKSDLESWCNQQGIPLHVFEWRPEHEKAGLARDAAYLLRPDTYVAVADPQASAETLAHYAKAHGFTLG